MLEKFEHDNVNGVWLQLNTEGKRDKPKSRTFTITYKRREKRTTPWPKIYLFLAVIFNIISLIYIRISLTALVVILIVLSFLIFFWVTHTVQSESVTFIPTVGIQSSIKYVCGSESSFIPWNSIEDVIINEVIKMNRVLYFLTVLVKPLSDSEQSSERIKLVPLFKYTKPRLQMIEKVYCEIQRLLTEEIRDAAAGDVG